MALIIPEAFAGPADNLYLHMLLHIEFDTSPGLVHIIPAVASLPKATLFYLLYLFLLSIICLNAKTHNL